MKQVFIIRHAKSSWKDETLRDFDRPLNKRGKRDAPFMAEMLRGKIKTIDHIVSSPAVRALTTAGYFAEAFRKSKSSIEEVPALYHAADETILGVTKGLEATQDAVLLFGHNPGLTTFVNRYSDEFLDNLPTCGIARIELASTRWREFGPSKARMNAFYYPKAFFS